LIIPNNAAARRRTKAESKTLNQKRDDFFKH
jgi:hypothetical protein